jgi:glutamine cyclotransferase
MTARKLILLAWLAAGCQTVNAVASPTAAPTPPPAAAPRYSPDNPTGLPPGLSQLSAPIWNYKVTGRFPHDPHAFTEGLLVAPGGKTFYESVGQYGESDVREVDIATGKVLRQHRLDKSVFGEGLAELAGKLYQLSWQNHLGFIYSPRTLKPSGTFRYKGEGWGLTAYGKSQFLMSDGTSKLAIRDQNFRLLKQVEVLDGVHPVTYVNELEMDGADLLANVWTTDYLAVIDPHSGKVKAWVDMRGLLSEQVRSQADVMNGIAYDPQRHKLYVTGKYWPTVFEIEIQK